MIEKHQEIKDLLSTYFKYYKKENILDFVIEHSVNFIFLSAYTRENDCADAKRYYHLVLYKPMIDWESIYAESNIVDWNCKLITISNLKENTKNYLNQLSNSIK